MVTTTAWADEKQNAISVAGTDHYGVVDSDGRIDVLLATAPAKTKLYVTVKYGNRVMLNDLEHEITSAEPELIMLSAKGVALDQLNKYTITVKDAQGEAGNVLYEGKFQGVYGTMHNAAKNTNEKTLIGVRTLATDGSENDRTFQAPSTFFYEGDDYKLAQNKPNDKGVYQYQQYNAEDTITGKITYVDQNGDVIRETPIEGIETKGSKKITLPAMIESVTDKGTIYYRVVHPSGNTITVSYPGQTEFVVHCKQMTFAGPVGSEAAYVAKIEYYDTTNNTLLMTDTLSVTKDFVYTVPTQFSQMRQVGKDANKHDVMFTYSLSGNQSSSALSGNGKLTLSAENPYGFIEDKSDAHTKYFRVNYTAENPEDKACVTYTVRFINAAENSTENGKILGTDTVSVTKEMGSFKYTPRSEITVGDVKYVPYGDSFVLNYSTSTNPVYDIYYVPEGYTPHDSYDVTVNYVNIANNEVLQTGKVNIDPTASGEVVIGPAPEKIEVNGVNYLRLDGQSQPFIHTYFTPARTYTVYYRDSRDQQYGNTVIRRTVVRTVDEGEGEDGTGGTGTTNADGAGAPVQATLSENGGELSSVDGGTGDGALLNGEGVDTATERELNDDATPLAQNTSKNQEGLLSQPAAIAVGVAVLAALAAGLYFFLRKRGNRKKAEAQL